MVDTRATTRSQGAPTTSGSAGYGAKGLQREVLIAQVEKREHPASPNSPARKQQRTAPSPGGGSAGSNLQPSAVVVGVPGRDGGKEKLIHQVTAADSPPLATAAAGGGGFFPKGFLCCLSPMAGDGAAGAAGGGGLEDVPVERQPLHVPGGGGGRWRGRGESPAYARRTLRLRTGREASWGSGLTPPTPLP